LGFEVKDWSQPSNVVATKVALSVQVLDSEKLVIEAVFIEAAEVEENENENTFKE
jgi:hypothetical protein